MWYYAQFPMPIPHLGVRSMLLLTLSPLTLAGSFDLHALAMPPAFNLSQDQTLQLFFVDVPDGGPGYLQEKKSACSKNPPQLTLSGQAWWAGPSLCGRSFGPPHNA